MTRRTLVAAFALLGALACSATPPASTLTAAHAAAIRDSVQATLDAFRRYSADGHWDSLAALYADDQGFRWMEQGVIQYRSPAQIREALRRVAPGTRIETSYFDTEILPLAPGVAAVTTIFQTRYMGDGNPGTEFGGVLAMTLVHRNGGWKILVGHSSSRRR